MGGRSGGQGGGGLGQVVRAKIRFVGGRSGWLERRSGGDVPGQMVGFQVGFWCFSAAGRVFTFRIHLSINYTFLIKKRFSPRE